MACSALSQSRFAAVRFRFPVGSTLLAAITEMAARPNRTKYTAPPMPFVIA